MLALALTLGACTNLLGLDKDYIAEDSPLSGKSGSGDASGGGASGGSASAGSGARDASIDDVLTDTASESDGTCNDGASCPGGQKCCAGICAAPAPILGCAASGCTPCPEPPSNGIAICKADQCGIECNAGHTELDGFCVASGDSGGSDASDAGDAGDAAPPCVARDCRSCGPIGPFPCCRNNGTCGCSWAFGSYCL